jgi:hypothetical protein
LSRFGSSATMHDWRASGRYTRAREIGISCCVAIQPNRDNGQRLPANRLHGALRDPFDQ